MDFNEDGRMDLISGEYDGTVHVYINVGTASDPILTDAGRIQIGDSDLTIGYYSDPALMDWNGDGLVDLLVGGGNGLVGLFINDGTPGSPHFSTKEYVRDGGSYLNVGADAGIDAADLDGDGLEDLIVGEYYGTLHFYRNQGVPGAPYFSGNTLLACSGEEITVPFYSRPCVVDWNNDGGFDLVLGQYLSTPILYMNDPVMVPTGDLAVTYTGPYYIGDEGGEVTFDVTVSNPSSQLFTFDLYVWAQNAPFGYWGPVLNYPAITLNPGQEVTRSLSRWVPGGAPSGYYNCQVLIGDTIEWEFLQQGMFSFNKW